MGEWFSYRLGDLLMFSPDVYFRLFERLNGWLWPVQIPALLIGAGLTFAFWSDGVRAVRWTGTLLGIAWLFVAWAFFIRFYAEIFLAAPLFAAAFALQGLLLILFALSGRLTAVAPDGAARDVGRALLVYALVFHPLLGLAEGRGWRGVELFLIAPDPTAVGTLAVLLTVRGGKPSGLVIIPLLWCLVSGATYWVMNAWTGLPAAFAAALAAVTMAWNALAFRSDRS